MADCRCGHGEHHCLSGHHHVVASLTAECNARLEQATKPRAVA